MPEPTASPPERPDASFDRQAARYDARAGFPAAVGAAVARAIVAAAGAGAGESVVELGAGTGEIGAHLACLPVRYLGLDNSPAMLAVFRAKAAGDPPALVVADCDRPWPVADGCAALVFASRVVHLLDPGHVAREAGRACRPGGMLILGRVLRDPDGLKERLRRRRQEVLREAGIVPRQGEAGTRHVVERCRAAGGEPLGRREVAEWAGETTPANVLAEWDALSRAGSVAVDRATRAGIMADLRAWARAEFGDLDRPEPFRERYAIDVVRLP